MLRTINENRRSVWLARVLLIAGLTFIAFAFTSANIARADNSCGGTGQEYCNIFKPCDAGLTPRKGTCHPCGAKNEYECPIGIQFPSCDSGLTAKGGKCHECGAKGEIECAITVQRQSCDSGLSARGGRCYACGGIGENECAITVQRQSCDSGLTAKGGKCHACGGVGEIECAFTVQMPSCDSGLSAKGGKCHACGGIGEIPCAITVQNRGCDIPGKIDKGICRASKGYPETPFTLYNQSADDIYYSVIDLPNFINTLIPITTNIYAHGSLKSGEAKPIFMGGGMCTSGSGKDIAEVSEIDTCADRSFTVQFWRSETIWRENKTMEAVRQVSKVAFGKATKIAKLGKVTGFVADKALSQAGGGYFDWVFTQIYGEDAEVGKLGLLGISPIVPQDAAHVVYWGDKNPVEFFMDTHVAIMGQEIPPFDIGTHRPPCEDPVPVMARLGDAAQRSFDAPWPGCGTIPRPG